MASEMRNARHRIVRAALCGAFLGACGPKSPDDPGVAVASSREAQTELRRLEAEWELLSGQKRTSLRADLERFVAEYRRDPSVPRARLLLAQIALMERRLDSAEKILEPILRGPVGPAQDEAHVILAAIENRRGNYQSALDRLAPLEGKLLSREARDQYARERTQAAIAARRWRLALDAMIAWLVEEESARHVKEWTASAIVQVPRIALARLLADWETEAETPEATQANAWIQRVIIEHLSSEALRAKDAHLARDLLQLSPPWLRAGKNGDALSVLSALAEKEARIVGRGVGVLIGGTSAEVQRRSAQVSAGIVRGLDLGSGNGPGAGVKMIATENRGSTSTALGTLTGLGASILVAGFDAAGATEAMAFAAARKVPVIVMHPPQSGVKSPYGFVFGVGEEAQVEVVQTSETFRDVWTLVGGEGTACPTTSSRPGTTELPWEEWRSEGRRAVLVLGDATCCSRVHSELSGTPWAPHIIFGLEGAGARAPGARPPFRLSSGQHPLVEETPLPGQMSEKEKALLAGNAPSPVTTGDFYFSLGVDVARLLAEALRPFPEAQVTEKEQVRDHYEKVRAALVDARAPLITADAQGFTSAGEILRTLRIRGREGEK